MHTSIDAAVKSTGALEMGHRQTLFDRLDTLNTSDIDAFEEIFGLKGLIDLRHVLVDLLTGPYAPPQMATPPQGSGTIGRTPNKSYPGVRLINPNLSYSEYEDSLRGLFLQINRYLMPILAKNTIRH